MTHWVTPEMEFDNIRKINSYNPPMNMTKEKKSYIHLKNRKNI